MQFLKAIKYIGIDALSHFNNDDGWVMASHVAMSTLFAIFPFMIFLTALASFLGAGAYAQTTVDFIFEILPQNVAKPISDEVHTVLSTPRGDLLTLSALAAMFFSSNGVEAMRVALNRAYQVKEQRNFFFRRVQSLGFVIISAIIMLLISVFLVALPLLWDWIQNNLPILAELLVQLYFWQSLILILMLVLGLFAAHLWLPQGKRRYIDCLPGIILTLIAWTIGAWGLGLYLAQFANYVSTYAGLASGVIALLFLYMVALVLILGAELNAAIIKYRA